MINLIGSTLQNRFKVQSFVASGGMSAVYKVWDLQRNVPLAMKVLHMDLVDDAQALTRFQREARALQKLTHPNIVPFYGLFHEEDLFFLLELFVDGPSLKDILRKQKEKLPLAEIFSMLKTLSAALGYAHTNGVVHCDVKPGNVMVDRSGQVYLTDFGVARHAESTTTTIGAAGTPAYMAPEQIRGEPVSASTDVYALGILLYELLTGRRPFTGAEESSENSAGTAAERVRFAHLAVAPPDPRTFDPEIPAALSAVVLTALHKDPLQRFRSTRGFFEAACEAAGFEPASIPERLPASLLADFFTAPGVKPGTLEPAISQNKQKWVIASLASIFLVFSLCAGGYLIGKPFLDDLSSSNRQTTEKVASLAMTETAFFNQKQLVVDHNDAPTNILQPTYTPLPTYTALPTYTPLPTRKPLPTQTPRPTSTEAPPPTRTPTQVIVSSSKCKVTIHNNYPFPLFFYVDGTRLNSDPIPPKMYMWFSTISRGEHEFKLCNANDPYECPYKRNFNVQGDLDLQVP